MKLKGTVEIDETNYRRDLEYAFLDYLEDDVRTPERFKECLLDRLAEDFATDIILDEETVAQVIKDAKRFIGEILKTV